MDKKKAIYLLGNMRLKGYAIEAGDGLHWFNTLEREKQGKKELLVSSSDLKVLI